MKWWGPSRASSGRGGQQAGRAEQAWQVGQVLLVGEARTTLSTSPPLTSGGRRWTQRRNIEKTIFNPGFLFLWSQFVFHLFSFCRKAVCVHEQKKASSSKRLTNSWKGKGGHTVNLWYSLSFSDCYLCLKYSLLWIVFFDSPSNVAVIITIIYEATLT